MEKMKKFLLYLIIFLLLFFIVTGLTNYATKNTYKDLKTYSENSEINITINEAKTSYSGGYIKGTVTNNSEKLINKIYIKADLYENDVYVGTEYKEIDYFNVKETTNFEITYKYTNINYAKISMAEDTSKIEESNKEDNSDNFIKLNTDSDTMKVAIPIAAILGILYILP